MTDSARVILTGRLGRDPESRYTPNGAMNLSFSMAVSRKWTTQAGVEGSNTTWFKVTAWKELAVQLDRLAQCGDLAKGKPVHVTGTLQQREWTNAEGQTRYSLDVTAFEVSLIAPDGTTIPVTAAVDRAQAPDFAAVPF